MGNCHSGLDAYKARRKLKNGQILEPPSETWFKKASYTFEKANYVNVSEK